MDDWCDPFKPPPPSAWSTLVRCSLCGDTYEMEETTYDREREAWVCRNERREGNKCLGADSDIVVVGPTWRERQKELGC